VKLVGESIDNIEEVVFANQQTISQKAKLVHIDEPREIARSST
jgi:hypothetical protein